jgi:hypothetical protein
VVLPLLHAEGGDLDHQHVLVFVHDQAAEEIALGVDRAIRRSAGHVAFAHGARGADALLEEVGVRLHAVHVQHADLDLGAGIVEAHAEHPVAGVLHLDEVAVVGGTGQAMHGGGVDPGMAGDDAVGFAGLENEGRERSHGL